MRFPWMLAFLPLVAFGVTVGSWPVSEYADTEVSTNVPFAVSLEFFILHFSFSIRTAEPRTGRLERLFVLKRQKLDSAWNLVKVMRRGVRSIGEVAVVTGSKPGFALEVR